MVVCKVGRVASYAREKNCHPERALSERALLRGVGCSRGIGFSVQISSWRVTTLGWKIVYISLGSNLGDRAANLARAIAALDSAGIRVTRQSPVYLTEPVDAPGQGRFLNAVVEAETPLLPLQLLHALLKIERELGRRRITAHGPRNIDLDLLFYSSSVIRSRELQVPHPRLTERRFVLIPLAQIAPEFRHPALHKSMTQLLAETRDRSEVKLWQAAAEIAPAEDAEEAPRKKRSGLRG